MGGSSQQRRGLGELEGPVLVAGGAGYIGSHTVRLLQEHAVPVVVLDNFSTGHRAAVRAPCVEADLADSEPLRLVFREHRPKAVIHFAAKCYVGESVVEPAKYYRENVVHSWNLLEAMRAADCEQIVFSSTCATYGVPREIPIEEGHPQAPISPYGRTKLAIEYMLEDYSRAYGLRFSALRYFNAAGAASDASLGEHHEPETHLIPLMLRVASGRSEEILIFGDDYETRDGTCVRDYIHVEDLADAHLRALRLLEAGRQQVVCNLGTGRGYSVREVLDVARRVTGHPIPARVVARREGDPAELVSGGRRATELLGWTPRRSELEQIVRDAWNFQCAHPDGFPT
ncbi:MAG: UDP-glucose 4-epimerase GalE [Deltaproteobacteria bacterium]|nr:MAG: UDP-glucose 4-epimerase GalE [Deltaproteobacteria bacterium]